jgi:hypothetical protein
VFARKADDGLASFVKHLDEVVTENASKKAKGTVVLLAASGDVAPVGSQLEAIARDEKIAHVPLTLSKDGPKGPEDYRLSENAAVTVVVYDKTMTVTEVLSFATFDEKAQKKVFAAFAKVLASPPEEKK